MKTLSLLIISSLIAVPSLAAADQAFMSINGGPMEALNGVSFGQVWVPGQPGASGTVGSPGVAYSSVALGDVNEDGTPDLMAMIPNANQDTAAPATFMITEEKDDGTVLGTLELDQALIYQVKFPGTKEVRNGHTGLDVTIVSPAPAQASPGIQIRREVDKATPLASYQITIPGVGTYTQDQIDVSPLTVTFDPDTTTALRVTSGKRYWEPVRLSVDIPTGGSTQDGFDAWMASTIANNGDERQVTVTYSHEGGHNWGLTAQWHMTGNHKDIMATIRRRKQNPQQEVDGGISAMDAWDHS